MAMQEWTKNRIRTTLTEPIVNRKMEQKMGSREAPKSIFQMGLLPLLAINMQIKIAMQKLNQNLLSKLQILQRTKTPHKQMDGLHLTRTQIGRISQVKMKATIPIKNINVQMMEERTLTMAVINRMYEMAIKMRTKMIMLLIIHAVLDPG